MITAAPPRPKIDRVTRDWVRNPSDEHALEHGCRFNVDRGIHAVWWIERFCRLYEGDQAGEPVVLRGCHRCGLYDLPVGQDWETALPIYRERAKRYAKCVAAGHPIDWQFECTMRVFAWVHHNEQRQRWVRRFRESIIFVAKKNKKSPTLSAWAMYLLIGDQEPGQKVFLAAKDGMQARGNCAKHAAEMVDRSPELSEACTVNKTLAQITHEPSRSIMLPLSSSNERTQKSKEGLNGSVFVDEVHVVDRPFMSRVSRAGISRAEPLHAEFSTAGDDPDSYGKERFDLGERILRGEEPDQWRVFVALYAAPQNLKPGDLDKDPLKYGRMANPAMGHTVDPTEFLDDYKKSSKSPAKLATFMMYRLDIWQNAASPWLSMVGWAKGKQDKIRLADFAGRPCWAAWDLSSVLDFTALSLCFPEAEDVYTLFWWFWLPQETYEAYKNLIKLEDWKADARTRLTITPGARVDYGYIRSEFRELAREFKIQEMAYDDWNAEQTTQELHEGVRDKSGVMIEGGTGVPRVVFSQGLKAFNEPSKRFEAAVIDGKIRHNGDPLATWMAGNATIRPDANGNYKPLKPRKDSVKKIDGVITAVMSFWRAVNRGSQNSVYDRENRGFRTFG